MSQTPITLLTDTFTRTNSATVGNGWTDVDSVFSIASNQLILSTTVGQASEHRLARLGDGQWLNQQVSVDLANLSNISNGQTVRINLRETLAGDSSLAATLTGWSATQVKMFTSIKSSSVYAAPGGYNLPTVIPSHPHRFTLSAVYNPFAGNTNFKTVLTDLITSTVVFTTTSADSTAAVSTLNYVSLSAQGNSLPLQITQIVVSDPIGIDTHTPATPPTTALRPELSTFGAVPMGRGRLNNGGSNDQIAQMTRQEHTALVDLDGIVIGHAGWYYCPDRLCENAFTVRSSVEYPILSNADYLAGIASTSGFGPIAPCYKDGGRVITVQPGATVKFDPVWIKIKAGDTFCTRHQVGVTTGQYYPNGLLTTTVGMNGRCQNPTSDMTVLNVDAGGSPFNAPITAGGYLPAFIGGIPSTKRPPVVAVIGTSISEGTGGTGYQGWAERAFASSCVFLNMGKGGSALALDQTDYWFSQRRYRLGLLAACDHVVIEHFVNEPGPILHHQANILSWANDLAALGVKVWVCTATTRTNSTDAFATIANQTVAGNNYAPGNGRDQFNTWVKAQPGVAGSPIFGVIDNAAAVVDPSTGKWLPNMTGDGVHPNDAGHTALAAAVNLAKFPAPSIVSIRPTF